MNKLKINENLKNNLFSTDTGKVLSAIQQIKEKGNKNYLPILFELLLSQTEFEIENAILKLLGTIKDKETISVFIEAINNPKFKDIQNKLISSCWQNGLDFGAYIENFVDIIIAEEWETAFEAFTVIENLEHFPEQEKLDEIESKINNTLEKVSDKKQYFLQEILQLIR